MMASTAWSTFGWVVAHEMTDTRMCAATIVLSRRHRLITAGRACSFVSLAEPTPYDLDSLAEGMQLRGAVFTIFAYTRFGGNPMPRRVEPKSELVFLAAKARA
ncbi:hypothetical protein [Paraburkholderia sp. SIMBA_030]|uniref:hypothetical protein n=1 Tax=Paraburkholderia sp. SIMBA_030 TaxID=3085773 RepID=UPI00397D3BD4